MPRKTKPPKRYAVNLNSYRNWKFIVSNLIKREYKRLVSIAIPKEMEPIRGKKVRLIFTLYKKTNRRIDRANVLAVTEKFFCDALVELGYLEDDNDDFIEESIYRSNGVDKENPRVECEIILLGENRYEPLFA